MKAVASLLFVASGLLASPAQAQTQVNWTTITSSTSTNGGPATATGTMTVGSTPVDVTIDARDTAFVQTGSSGSYYWSESSPAPYTGGQYSTGSGYVTGQTLADKPSDNSIVAFASPTHVTITFSQAVSDVYMALVSWNGDGIANFTSPFSLVSSGRGAYGEGYFDTVTASGFSGNGELHGVIEFTGPITTLSFDTTGTDYWHGMLIGTEALAPITSDVPEVATWGMMILGFGAAGATIRRSRTVRIRYA